LKIYLLPSESCRTKPAALVAMSQVMLDAKPHLVLEDVDGVDDAESSVLELREYENGINIECGES
jgi:uncharacterized protein (DUF362 family)